jgi:anti-sigma-K factor RskA
VSEPFDALDVALDEVAPSQRAAAEERLRHDPAFAAEVERLRSTAAPLEALPPDAWRPPEPPPLRLPVAASDPRQAAERPRVLTLRPLLAVAAAVALLAAGVAGTLAAQALDGDPGGTEVALAPLPGAEGARATAVLQRDAQTVRFEVRGLPATGRESFYELWLLNAPDDLVAVGTFRVAGDGSAEVSFPLAVDPERFRVLDVSLEPVDGDPGHSSRSVLRSQPL